MHTADSNPLRRALDHAAHLLPAQGPIGVFIHHNTLHAFQHRRFEDAVVEAAGIFGAEPYMTEEAYRRQSAEGRILQADVDWVLEREPNAGVLPGRLDRRSMRRALLDPRNPPIDPASVRYLLHEAGYFTGTPEGRALWAAFFSRLAEPSVTTLSPARPRDGVLWKGGSDLDSSIHPLLIRLCATYTDQGMSYWPMPLREHGFYGAVRDLLSRPGAIYPAHLRGLDAEFGRQRAAGLDGEGAVSQILGRLGLAEFEWESFITAELLALPGWPGLMRLLERDPGLAPHVRLPCSLMDYLAVRLTFTLVALERLAGNTKDWRKASAKSEAAAPARTLEAAGLFECAQACAVPAADVAKLDDAAFERWRLEVAAFSDLERRRIWHVAYERRHELLILGPLGHFRQSHPPRRPAKPPVAQVFLCIDEREESMRRAIEETDPEIETFGAAGFFGVAIDYQGIDDAHAVSLCPVVVKPQHSVRERAREGEEDSHRERVRRRKQWAGVVHGYSVGSKLLLRGWFSTALLGVLSLFPLIARILSPRHYARLRTNLKERFFADPRTELAFMHGDVESHHATEGLALGFTSEEKATRVAGVLGGAGLTSGFSDLVVILGHGSTSLNNPHESAHDCGACGGRRGGPNARLFAAMANRQEVREALRAKGIDIPDRTWFIGGYHDTCSDDVDLYDTDLLPAASRALFDRVCNSLDRARALDALERARRFEAAEGARTPADGLLHVEERAEHLAEPRPEYGHCTNAVAVVGRRAVTRGLFMDRRAFLISYDASGDPEDKFLAGVLGAVIPVCAGISLEYYFSFVDNERYGCGTKLPHNVTGLLGVMNGHAGDLRTGLPWQMVEIHEPVRILFVIETTPERLIKVVGRSAELTEFVENAWVRVAVMDPESGAIQVYRGGGGFEPAEASTAALPVAAASHEWYSGKIQHLPLAEIVGRL